MPDLFRDRWQAGRGLLLPPGVWGVWGVHVLDSGTAPTVGLTGSSSDARAKRTAEAMRPRLQRGELDVSVASCGLGGKIAVVVANFNDDHDLYGHHCARPRHKRREHRKSREQTQYKLVGFVHHSVHHY